MKLLRRNVQENSSGSGRMLRPPWPFPPFPFRLPQKAALFFPGARGLGALKSGQVKGGQWDGLAKQEKRGLALPQHTKHTKSTGPPLKMHTSQIPPPPPRPIFRFPFPERRRRVLRRFPVAGGVSVPFFVFFFFFWDDSAGALRAEALLWGAEEVLGKLGLEKKPDFVLAADVPSPKAREGLKPADLRRVLQMSL